jgi:hypothetical protein
MGKSNTIEQQAKLNADFQKYIDEQTKVLDEMAAKAEVEIKARIDDYYKQGNWKDAAPLIQGKYQHLSTVSEWSLDSVTKMINALHDAIFGKAPAPDGSKAPAQTSDLAANVAKMSDMTLLITSAAFNAVQGIMASLTSGTETNIQKDYATKELAPGLTLFVCVIENQFRSSSFLNNEIVLQSGYVFDTRFSSEQAGDIAKFDQVQSLISQQHTAQDLIHKFNVALEALDVDAEDYDAKSTKYQASIDKLNDRVKALQDRIAELTK